MAWQGRGSTRAWRKARAQVLDRDGHRCVIGFPGCTIQATEVDHIVAAGRPTTDRWQPDDLDNLRSTCTHCHKIVTAAQSRAARTRWRRQPERHPGML